MRLAVVTLLAVLVLGALVGVLVARDPGYVLVAYDRMAVETSLWFALVALLAGYLLLRGLWLVVRWIGGSGTSLKLWSQQRRSRVAQEQTERGLVLLAEGQFAEARKRLESAAPRVQAPLLNYLGAARAAHRSGDLRGRDELLHTAHESAAGSALAVGLTQAELQRADGQWEPCLATLLQLKRREPRHVEVLRMLAECYRHLHDWQAVLELMDDLRKQRVLSDDALRELQLEAWQKRLQSTRDDPLVLWKAVPRELKREPALAAAAAAALAALDRSAQAEPLLRSALEQTWHADLLNLYGTLAGDPARQLVVAEGWLKERPNDPDLLLALGRISLMNRAWARAREYLEASLRLRRSAAAQAELGRLCAALGDAQRGAELLAQSVDSLPDLPLPERSERMPA